MRTSIGPLLLAYLSMALLSPRAISAQTLGTVTNNGIVACGTNGDFSAAIGAVCYSITVSCPNTVDLNARVAISTPSGNIGSITMMGAGQGKVFFADEFANKYVSLGYQTVQVAFATLWEDSGLVPGNALYAACRPATIFKWIYTNFHTGGSALPYCLQGYSAGSGAVAFALTHYGLKSIVDAAMLAAGPPMGDMYQGCTTPSIGRIPVSTCGPGFVSYYKIPPTHGSSVAFPDAWDHTSTCSNNPTPSDEAIWAASSIDTAPADYSYPQTKISSFQCIGNNAPGQGMFFFNKVSPSSISLAACNYSGSISNPTGCAQEAYWLDYNGSKDTTRYNQMITQMQTDCVPRH